MFLVGGQLQLDARFLSLQSLNFPLVVLILSLHELDVFEHLVSVTDQAVDVAQFSNRLLLQPLNLPSQSRYCILGHKFFANGFQLLSNAVFVLHFDLVVHAFILGT